MEQMVFPQESLGSTYMLHTGNFAYRNSLQYILSACEESGICATGTVGDDKKNKDNLCPSDT